MAREPITMNKFVNHSITRARKIHRPDLARHLSFFDVVNPALARMRVLEEEMEANEGELRQMETEYDELIEALDMVGLRQ